MGWMKVSGVKAVLPCAVLAGAAVLAGCDEHIVVDRDPSVRVQHGMTWAWRPAPAQRQDARSSDGARSDGGRRVVSRDVISPRDQAPRSDRGDRPQRDFPKYTDPSK